MITDPARILRKSSKFMEHLNIVEVGVVCSPKETEEEQEAISIKEELGVVVLKKQLALTIISLSSN